MLLALVAQRSTSTNAALAAAAPAEIDCRLLTPRQALALEAPDYAVVGRLDVKPTLDGVDDGLSALGTLLARGVPTLNPPSALLGAHDKLLTSRLLHGAGLPHPRTSFLAPGAALPEVTAPVVVKPRFVSWGRDVVVCEDERALRQHVDTLERRRWFRVHGALVQELVPPQGRDLRSSSPAARSSARSPGWLRRASGARTSRSARSASRSSRPRPRARSPSRPLRPRART
jgi:hypothetical protein